MDWPRRKHPEYCHEDLTPLLIKKDNLTVIHLTIMGVSDERPVSYWMKDIVRNLN